MKIKYKQRSSTKYVLEMYDWITNLFNTVNQTEDKNKYGLQTSLTLSTHTLLENYCEDIRALNQEEPKDASLVS